MYILRRLEQIARWSRGDRAIFDALNTRSLSTSMVLELLAVKRQIVFFLGSETLYG